ncbi:MAG: glutathione S-transferase family protein [Myxococcales bacterium]|nr:glutathione S-transferase family protein [Myxococcales bacterium]
MKLYTNPLSPNSRRASMVAIQAEVPVDVVVLDFAKGEHKAPDYLAINPNGMVPTLVDGDLQLFESRAIAQHLALKAPDRGLFPTDPQSLVDIARWQFWDALHFSAALRDIAFEKLFKPMMGMGDPDAAKIEDGKNRFARFGAVLNTHLAGRDYVVGTNVTIADLGLAASLTYAVPCEVSLADHPNVAAWFEKMTSLESWKQTLPPLGG